MKTKDIKFDRISESTEHLEIEMLDDKGQRYSTKVPKYLVKMLL